MAFFKRKKGTLEVRGVTVECGAPQSGPVDGVTLAPGEATSFDLELPPELQALIEAGLRLTFEQGPAVYKGGGRWQRELVCFANGKRQGAFGIEWTAAG